MKQVSAWVCNGLPVLLPSCLPTVVPVPSGGRGCSGSVSLPCTNPGLLPLCQYTSKLLSCKVTSEVLFNLFVLVFLHVWPGACGCGLPFPGGLNEKDKKTVCLRIFLFLLFLNWGNRLHTLACAQQRYTLLCRVVRWRSPCPVSWIWKMFLVSSGTDSRCTCLVRKQCSSRGPSPLFASTQIQGAPCHRFRISYSRSEHPASLLPSC